LICDKGKENGNIRKRTINIIKVGINISKKTEIIGWIGDIHKEEN